MCDTGFCTAPASAPVQTGGYKPTPADMALLRKYKRGQSIGFTGRSSLRAKGLLPRKSKKYRGKYVLGPKYSGTGAEKVLRGPSKTRSNRHRQR